MLFFSSQIVWLEILKFIIIQNYSLDNARE